MPFNKERALADIQQSVELVEQSLYSGVIPAEGVYEMTGYRDGLLAVKAVIENDGWNTLDEEATDGAE